MGMEPRPTPPIPAPQNVLVMRGRQKCEREARSPRGAFCGRGVLCVRNFIPPLWAASLSRCHPGPSSALLPRGIYWKDHVNLPSQQMEIWAISPSSCVCVPVQFPIVPRPERNSPPDGQPSQSARHLASCETRQDPRLRPPRLGPPRPPSSLRLGPLPVLVHCSSSPTQDGRSESRLPPFTAVSPTARAGAPGIPVAKKREGRWRSELPSAWSPWETSTRHCTGPRTADLDKGRGCPCPFRGTLPGLPSSQGGRG